MRFFTAFRMTKCVQGFVILNAVKNLRDGLMQKN